MIVMTLSYIEYEKNIIDKKKIDALTSILANKLASFKTRLNKQYEIYVSGGGVLEGWTVRVLTGKDIGQS